MSGDLGTEIQNMFKSIYDAADLKYLRPLKVSQLIVGSFLDS